MLFVLFSIYRGFASCPAATMNGVMSELLRWLPLFLYVIIIVLCGRDATW